MKILSIGNSFSTDAQRWLNAIAESAGSDIYCANLYIGGCSLERHWHNYQGGEEAYDYEINGEFQRKISIQETLGAEEWDVITLQQVSGLSGIFSSFEPYLTDLIAEVKKARPKARLLLHKTWAYEIGSGHPDFNNYGCSQKKMFEEITKAYCEATQKTGLKVIPVGDAIQHLRENVKEFDIENGGISLTRDSFHLSYDYGRFAAGLVWFKVLTGKSASEVSFMPQVESSTTDGKILDIIKNAIDQIL